MSEKLKAPPVKFEPGFIESLDQRTAIATEMRSRYAALTSDLGGNESLSYGQRMLAERVLWLEFWLKREEEKLATGSEFDVGKWTQAVNSLQGLLTKLGLERKAGKVPALHDYIKGRTE